MLNKFSLIILTRCNLKCRLCCEYIPQNKPYPDMTLEEADEILTAAFYVFGKIRVLHLTGGGEPFLHPKIYELVESAMKYSDKFGKLMLFTNGTVPIPDRLLNLLVQHNNRVVVQISQYHIRPKTESDLVKTLEANGITCKVERYYGDSQAFGGWVDFGKWESHNRSSDELSRIFRNCAVTRDMNGNWRTRDGKAHWCSRSQRGMEMGLIPDNPNDYIDLLDDTISAEQKREQFEKISKAQYITACDYCSGHQGTDDESLRFPAAEQI